MQHASDQQTNKKAGTSVALSVAIVAGIISIVGIIIAISVATLTSKESTLLSTFLTFLAVGIGWGISHYYATQDKAKAIADVRDFEQRTLRTYALKAAEKVTNLSRELNRLSAYLQEELEYTEYRSAEEELFAKEERLQSAIHLIGSLRSINDTSLSDWQGVIGEELQEQQLAVETRVETLAELAGRIATLERNSVDQARSNDVEEEIEELKRTVRSLTSDVSGVSFTSRKVRPTYRQVDASCPECQAPVRFKLRDRDGARKAVQCKECSCNLIAEYTESGDPTLRKREQLEEEVNCPTCHGTVELYLDEWPTASTTVVCSHCNDRLTVSRIERGKNIRAVLQQGKAARGLTPEVLERIRVALPPQPWPKGVHMEVAQKLGERPQNVKRAISHFIKAGIFSDQIDGVLCTPAEKLALLRAAGESLWSDTKQT